jgi:lipopolysaccharide export system permease protein
MLFDSSVRNEVSRSFAGTLIVILTIVLTMMLIRTLGLAAGGRVGPQDVILVLGYTALAQLPLILSLSMFIAIIATLTRMYRDSEMVIWLASGVSLWRLLPVVLRLAFPALVAVVVLSLLVWPWANRQGAELRGRYEQRSDLSRVAPGQFQTSADGQRVFFIDKDTSAGAVGRNVFVLANQDGREAITTAQSGRIVPVDGLGRLLTLEAGARTDIDLATGERTLARFEQYQVRVDERDLNSLNELPPKARATATLWREPTPRNHGELAWRIGTVAVAINLMLLGVGLAAGNPRRHGSWSLLLALLTFVVYFNLLSLSQAWVSAGKLGLVASLLLIHGGVMAGALSLMWWRDRGASTLGLRLAWPRRAPAA